MSDAAKTKDFVDSYLTKRYSVGRCLGKGAYGIVWRVIERSTGKRMALKKCFDAFQNSTDAQRTFREIMFLQELNGHENIVRLMSVLKAESQDDIYVLFDAMESDLSNVINAGFLSSIHHEYITYQVLKALKYVHSGGILHRDLKPSNVLLNSNCHVRICDFGLARTSMSHGDAKKGGDAATMLTDYVATRWYRAPELLLGAQMYHEGVDMWSVGCIIGEMMSGKPILKGRSTLNQLEKIMELTGKPTEDDFKPISAHSPYARSMMESLGAVRQMPSASILFLVKAPPEARKLILAMTRFNPDKRPSAEASLEDSFVEKFHLQEAEPTCDKIIRMPIADNNKLKADDYRRHIYQQISVRKQQAKLDEIASGRRRVSKRRVSKGSYASTDEGNGSMEPSVEQPWCREGGSQAPPTTPDQSLRLSHTSEDVPIANQRKFSKGRKPSKDAAS